MTYVLIEQCSPELDLSKGEIIALTPQVCYALSHIGLRYTFLEAFGGEEAVAQVGDEYWHEQLAWASEFDMFLHQVVSELQMLKLNVTTTYLYTLRKIVDSLVIGSLTLEAFFSQARPSNIIYYLVPSEKTILDEAHGHLKPDIMHKLIPLFCQKYGTKLSIRPINSQGGGHSSWVKTKLYAEVFDPAKSLARRTRWIWRCRSERMDENFSPQVNPLTLLILGAHTFNVPFLMRRAVRRGHRVFLLRERNVFSVSPWNIKPWLELTRTSPQSQSIIDSPNWTRAISDLAYHENLWKWTDVRCGVPVSHVLRQHLENFVYSIAPKLTASALEFQNFYRQFAVDWVIGQSPSSLEEHAAYAAALLERKTKSIVLQHGSRAFRDIVWPLTDMQHADYFFVDDEGVADEADRLAQDRGGTPEVRLGSYYYRELQRRGNELRRRWNSCIVSRRIRPRIIYVPTTLQGDARWFTGSYQQFPSCWYYEFQKELVDFFASMDAFFFVVKGLPTSDRVYNPIKDHIRDRHYTNVTFTGTPFTEWLPRAHRVIVDLASTALYEATAYGVPCLLLQHEYGKLRRSALERLKCSVCCVSQASDAFEATQDFLTKDLPRPTYQFAPGTILSQIEEIFFGEYK